MLVSWSVNMAATMFGEKECLGKTPVLLVIARIFHNEQIWVGRPVRHIGVQQGREIDDMHSVQDSRQILNRRRKDRMFSSGCHITPPVATTGAWSVEYNELYPQRCAG